MKEHESVDLCFNCYKQKAHKITTEKRGRSKEGKREGDAL